MSEVVGLLNSVGVVLTAFAARMLIQSSLLIVALALLDLVLRKRVKAVVRYWIWLLVLAKLLVPPSLSSPTGLAYWIGDKLPDLPKQVEIVNSSEQGAGWTSARADDFGIREQEQHGLEPMLREPRVRDSGAFAAPAGPAQTAAETSQLPPVTITVTPVTPITWQAVVLLAWAVVVLVMTVLLIQRAVFVRRLVAQSEPAPATLVDLLVQCRRQIVVGTEIGVRLSGVSVSPSVCGLWRPVILVPNAMLAQLDTAQLKSILLHELAHIKRGDLWINLAQALLQIVYFFHPLLWLANAMIRRVREQAVDETVLAAMGDEAEEYPKTLLSVSRLAFGRPALSLRLLGVVESKKALTTRIRHIVSRPFPSSAKVGLLGLVLVLVVAVVLLPMARGKHVSEVQAPGKPDEETQFKRALSNGLSIELLGVCEHPTTGKPWRRPDGTALTGERPGEFTFNDPDYSRPDAHAKVLALRLTGQPLNDVTLAWTLETGGGPSTFYPAYEDAARQILQPVQAIVAAFPKNPAPADLKIGIAAGAWGGAAAASEGRTTAYARDNITQSDVIYYEPREENGAIHITATHLLGRDYDCRIVAEDEAHNVFEPAQYSNSGDKMRLCTSVLNVPLAKVKWFRLQARPYEWVEFKNIQLMPNSPADSNDSQPAGVRTIAGVVTDPLGRPRGNVYIAPSGANLWKGTRSDVQGKFVLKDVQPEQTVWAAWSQPMNAMALFTIAPGPIDKPIQVKLIYSEAHIEGRVVGPNGDGLAGRKMEYVIKTSDGETYVFQGWGESDKLGNYEDGLIPCGTGLTVQARLAGASETDREYVTEAVVLSDGQIFIAMPRLVVGDGQPPETDDGKLLFKGRIVDARREAVCGAKITLNFDMPGWMSMWVRYTLTDRDGRWQMRVPKEYSDLSISLDHPDYIGSHFDRSSKKPSKQELLDGTHVLVMNSGVRITGVVKDGQGKPIENALVTAGRFYSWSPYGEVDEDSTTARTLDNGTFSIGGLPEEQLDMMVSATGYAPRIVPVDVKKDMPVVETALAAGRTYTGHVVDADGRPIEGVSATMNTWRLGRGEHHLTRIATTDAQGLFRMEDLPGEGTLECHFGKRDSGLMSFSREVSADLSQVDKLIMYKNPVFTGKVIDAETQQPVTKFTLINGIRGPGWGDRPGWSDHYKEQINANDGAFTYKWSGYSVTQPFTGDALLKVEVKGYLSEMAPPLKLGETCKPFVIRLTKAEPRTGVVLTAGGQPAAEAEVGWVGPDDRAFLTDGRFSTRGYSYQADQIVKTGADGRFELDRTRDEGLIVAVHRDGYAAAKSTEFTNGSKIALTPWARIEGSIVPGGPDGKQLAIAVEQAMSSEALEAEPVRWMFDEVSITGNRFALEHVPATPLYVGAIIRWEHSDPAYLNPEPGKTYSIEIGAKGRPVSGRIIHPSPGAKMEMSDPRRLHAVAYRIDPEPPMPAEIKSVTRAPFQWLWRDADTVYDRSRMFQKRFVPEITDDGEFTFAALAPGKYEFVVNYHVPLGENVSCGRGVLDAVAVSEFMVPDNKAASAIRVPDVPLRLLRYPKVGEPAPLFEAKTFDGGTVKLADLRGKFVLLDFWASWCTPCVAQLPQVQQLYETFGADEKFAMVGMSLDWDIEKAKRFLAGRQLKWPQVSLGNMDTSAVVKQYGVGSIPTTVLIDPEGKIIAMGLSIDQLKERIRTTLAARL